MATICVTTSSLFFNADRSCSENFYSIGESVKYVGVYLQIAMVVWSTFVEFERKIWEAFLRWLTFDLTHDVLRL